MKNLTAKDLMNRELLTITEDMSVREAADFLTQRNISGAPVVDSSGNLAGVLSVTDIAQNVARKRDPFLTERNPDVYFRNWEETLNLTKCEPFRVEREDLLVRDVMTPEVFSVSQGTSLPEMASVMSENRLHRLFVTHGNRLVGIVSTMDILKVLAGEKGR